MVAKGYCLDASALIEAWGSVYPPAVFPTLWQQLKRHKDKLTIIEPILDEIKPGHGGLREWLDSNGFTIAYDTESESLRLEKDYKIDSTTKGVNKNDIMLIAHAKVQNKTVVTSENYQTTKPSHKCNYKIPLVCKTEGVACITFIKMLEELGVRI